MKIIFLDIDGVLNTTKDEDRPRVQPEGFNANIYGVSELNRECVARLNKIVEATQASVVISSSWRILFSDLFYLVNFLKSQGVVANIIDATPHWAKSYVRGEMAYGRGLEIQEWLDEHPEVSKFVILDDGTDMLHLEPFLIQTYMDGGLQDRHIQQAIDMLK